MGNVTVNNKLFVSRADTEPIYCNYRRRMPRSEDYHLHLSNYWELYILIEGEADRIVEDRCFSLKPYDVIILNPYEPHSHRVKKMDWYERLYFHILPDAFSFMKSDPMELLMRENGKGHNLIALPPEKKEELKGLLEVFKREWDKGDRATELAGVGAIFGILSLLNGHIASLGDGQENDAPAHEMLGDIPPVVFDVLRYIENNVSANLSEEALAARFHISTSYLSRLFKKHIGQGLKRYMVIRKIGYAKKLLDGGSSVTETCFACGFNDCSYFIKVFKLHTGMTPYRYQLFCKQTEGN